MANRTQSKLGGSGIRSMGKTTRDRATGAQGRNKLNQEVRKAWDRQTTASARSARKSSDFPHQVCNGRDTVQWRAAEKRGGKETRKAREMAAGRRQTEGPPKEG